MSRLSVRIVEAALDALGDDGSPAVTLRDLLDDHGAWDVDSGDEDRVGIVEGNGAWWVVRAGQWDCDSRRCRTLDDALLWLARWAPDVSAYSISNTSGVSGGPWGRLYNSQAAAAEALRVALGWATVVLSASFATLDGNGDEHTAWCAYETQEECDADAEGASAPRIERE